MKPIWFLHALSYPKYNKYRELVKIKKCWQLKSAGKTEQVINTKGKIVRFEKEAGYFQLCLAV